MNKEQPSRPPHPRRSSADAERSPSRSEGLPQAEVAKIRVEYFKFFMDFGKQLRYPTRTIASSIVYFHRFYMRHPYVRDTIKMTALACLFLAAKSEGTIRKMRNFCTEYFQYDGRNPIPAQDSKVARQLEEEIRTREALLMKTVQFAFWIEHPMRYFLTIVKRKFLKTHGPEKTKRVAREGYAIIIDSFRTNVCLSFSPQEIAIATLYMIAEFHRLHIPKEQQYELEWFEELSEELTIEDIIKLRDMILSQTDCEIGKEIKKSIAAAPSLKKKEETKEGGGDDITSSSVKHSNNDDIHRNDSSGSNNVR